MRFYVCLFGAAVDDAAAIRSVVTTGERRMDDWPHLVVPGVDGPDMNVLERLAKPKKARWSSRIGGELLDRSKLTATPFTAVSRLTPEFVEFLAELDPVAAKTLSQAWSQKIDAVPEDQAHQLVQQISAFARQSLQTRVPVLELVRM